MKLVFSTEAERDAEAIDTWWRQHRIDAPRLFAEELESVCMAIERKPTFLKPYATRGGVVIRRWLLEETLQHVYYAVDSEAGVVTVLRIWGARRARGPNI